MGREVRMVPSSWKHPKNDEGEYEPIEADEMPEWSENQATHYRMYETCSEGTPISPPMETPEALARWLADNNASAFGGMTATYEQWLSTIKRGWACSGMYARGKMMSGVEGLHQDEEDK